MLLLLVLPTTLPYMSSSVAGVITATQATPSFQLFSSSTTIHVSIFHASSSSSLFTLLQATPVTTCKQQVCLKFHITMASLGTWYSRCSITTTL